MTKLIQWEWRRLLIGAALMGALFVTIPGHASDTGKSCLAAVCAAGDEGVTVADRADPYYACPTFELSEYSNFGIELATMDAPSKMKMGNMSHSKSEAGHLDDKNGPNRAQLFLERLRNAAGVHSFDDAVAMCAVGKNKLRVKLMNVPDQAISIQVMDLKTKQSFWMPSSHIHKR